MTQVVCDLTISLDGYAAGPDQSREHPLGLGGERLHRWQFEQPEENAAVFVLTHRPHEPIVPGAGERLFTEMPGFAGTPVSARATPLVTHVTYRL